MTVHNHSYAIVDAHVHYPDPTYQDSFVQQLDHFGVSKFSVMCVPHARRLSVVPEALHLKAHYPDRVYVFGSVDFSAFRTNPEHVGRVFAQNVDTLLAMGCDGVKMWEGKPDIRKKYGIPPFDSPAYAPFWERLAACKLPVLMHINDPAEFWDLDAIPKWALERGWFYGDGSYVNNEAQYQEMFNVLDRHPDLTIIFAHFFFFSNELARLGRYLDRYPNVYIDLTPGSEMYKSFSLNPNESREFFLKYQNRIIYGTDFGARAMLATWDEYDPIPIDPVATETLFHLVRDFLEVDGPYALPTPSAGPFKDASWTLRGIGLPDEVRAKVCERNFIRIVGQQPRPINPEAVVEECDRLIRVIKTPGLVWPGRVGDTTFAELVREYFDGHKYP